MQRNEKTYKRVLELLKKLGECGSEVSLVVKHGK